MSKLRYFEGLFNMQFDGVDYLDVIVFHDNS